MEWLSRLFESLLSVFPRLWLVLPDEGGIRITLGKYVKKTSAGWYVWWPLIQNCTKLAITPQALKLPEQSIESKDGKPVVINCVIQYKVMDVRKALLNVESYEDMLTAIASRIVIGYTKNRTLVECWELEKLEGEIEKGTRDKIGNWGLKVQGIYVTQLTRAKTVRIMLDSEGASGRIIS
jgi:regulator of protease activity HflC (stomatin/prohibitin superfamily)